MANFRNALTKSNLTICLLFSCAALSATPKNFNRSKINARLAAGAFTPAESGGEAVQSTGAPEFSYTYFLRPNWGVYLGGDFFPTTQENGIYIWGIKAGTRLYFPGTGVAVIDEVEQVKIKRISKWAGYGLFEIKQYNYFLGTNPTVTNNEIEQKGTFFNYNIGFGIEYRLSHEFDVNFEVSHPVMTQASTDNRINFSGRILALGVGFQF